MGIKQLSQIRDRLEQMLSINTGDSYIDSTAQLDDINDGYEQTAYAYDWPSLLTRKGIVVVANLNQYALPSDFRKIRTLKLNGVTLTPTELEFLKRTRNTYTLDQTQGDVIVNPIPTTASTAYTLSNAESAGNAVTIELDTVSGLSQHDEIWIDSASGTDEFSLVSSVGTLSIVARLYAAKSASDILYRQKEIIDLQYQRKITLLSATGDTTLLPSPLDFIMLHKSAAIAYERLELYDEAKRQDDIWKMRMQEMWLAFSRGSTGESNHFSI